MLDIICYLNKLGEVNHVPQDLQFLLFFLICKKYVTGIQVAWKNWVYCSHMTNLAGYFQSQMNPARNFRRGFGAWLNLPESFLLSSHMDSFGGWQGKFQKMSRAAFVCKQLEILERTKNLRSASLCIYLPQFYLFEIWSSNLSHVIAVFIFFLFISVLHHHNNLY